ncbi:glycosyltransferase involved in cell wall biosynthesis [Methanohalophilus euhalobius]|uniref:Glycosyltransferase involved in cell wall biosynthesis n=1 Tax=Methanohalophilus euhalobius TaxID=51203 RepID=A0A285GB93_9EURY|nr:MAG: glycosyl transferase family 2 [Methanohalophilus sp. 2-GBenrich]TCL11587.1 glycosyltransferase involved in cell wall biosynthesis [Methanohalophilus euhalobius]SNY20688.1 Glycosyltransferase involved in cell wall bisynthesis [Methanohalophilus euhalobius]
MPTIAAMPAYNEAKSIHDIVVDCKKYVDTVLVIDDGSSDNTAEVAESAGAYVVQHPKNMGYGAAIKSCFETARSLNAKRMVIIDSDGQHDPAEIPKLLKPLERGVDVVLGSRFIDGTSEGIPVYRKVGMKVLDLATNTVGGMNVTDSQCGFRAYGKKAIQNIRINSDSMSAGSEILMEIADNNLRYEEVQVNCSYDVEDSSTQNPVSHGVGVLIAILKDMEFRRPLYYFTLPGALMAGTGLFMGLKFLQEFYHGEPLSFGPTLLMMLLTILGMFMTFTGIILHAIARMMRRLEVA